MTRITFLDQQHAGWLSEEYGVEIPAKVSVSEAFDIICIAMGAAECILISDKYKRGIINEYLHKRASGCRHRYDIAAAAQRRLVRRHNIQRGRRYLAASIDVPVSDEASFIEHRAVLVGLPSELFYRCKEWLALRTEALHRANFRCRFCGIGVADGAVLHVDHIKTRIAHPDLAFSLSNLRVLCEPCHRGRHYSDAARVSR